MERADSAADERELIIGIRHDGKLFVIDMMTTDQREALMDATNPFAERRR